MNESLENYTTDELTKELEKRRLFTEKLPASVFKRILDYYNRVLDAGNCDIEDVFKIAQSTIEIYKCLFKVF